MDSGRQNQVVPYIGTWIETLVKVNKNGKIRVVPYIGTWIETLFLEGHLVAQPSYLI